VAPSSTVERAAQPLPICLDVSSAIAQISGRGGIHTIAISHPHYYTAMVEWAERWDARVLLHEADREWIMRPSRRLELWARDRLELSAALTPDQARRPLSGWDGVLVARWRGGRGALLSGDIVQVVDDRDGVSFMWSYPKLIPLPPREVARMREVIAGLSFDRVYGAF
jgi:hypothetical protein